MSATSIDANKRILDKNKFCGNDYCKLCDHHPRRITMINLTIASSLLESFTKVEINEYRLNEKSDIIFNGQLDDDLSIESFSLPPVPPSGSFDVRFVDGYRLSESDEVTIQLQNSTYPVTVIVTASRYDIRLSDA